jgi:hypothetical protein
MVRPYPKAIFKHRTGYVEVRMRLNKSVPISANGVRHLIPPREHSQKTTGKARRLKRPFELLTLSTPFG